MTRTSPAAAPHPEGWGAAVSLILSVAREIEDPRTQRPGMQRRRQWADRLRSAVENVSPDSDTIRPERVTPQ